MTQEIFFCFLLKWLHSVSAHFFFNQEARKHCCSLPKMNSFSKKSFTTFSTFFPHQTCFSVKCTFYYFYFTVIYFPHATYKAYKKYIEMYCVKGGWKSKSEQYLNNMNWTDTLMLEDREIHCVNGQQRDNSRKTKCYAIILQVMNLFY